MTCFNKLLVLDLDETLIYATQSKLERKSDFKTGFYFEYKRPDVEHFLQGCFEWFNVGVWTSATEVYAYRIIIRLSSVKVQHVWLLIGPH